jgi:hypothetical protein
MLQRLTSSPIDGEDDSNPTSNTNKRKQHQRINLIPPPSTATTTATTSFKKNETTNNNNDDIDSPPPFHHTISNNNDTAANPDSSSLSGTQKIENLKQKYKHRTMGDIDFTEEERLIKELLFDDDYIPDQMDTFGRRCVVLLDPMHVGTVVKPTWKRIIQTLVMAGAEADEEAMQRSIKKLVNVLGNRLIFRLFARPIDSCRFYEICRSDDKSPPSTRLVIAPFVFSRFTEAQLNDFFSDCQDEFADLLVIDYKTTIQNLHSIFPGLSSETSDTFDSTDGMASLLYVNYNRKHLSFAPIVTKKMSSTTW